jgi:hypothetical protein
VTGMVDPTMIPPVDRCCYAAASLPLPVVPISHPIGQPTKQRKPKRIGKLESMAIQLLNMPEPIQDQCLDEIEKRLENFGVEKCLLSLLITTTKKLPPVQLPPIHGDLHLHNHLLPADSPYVLVFDLDGTLFGFHSDFNLRRLEEEVIKFSIDMGQ